MAVARAAGAEGGVRRAAIAAALIALSPLPFLMAGCERNRDLTAAEATDAANEQIAEVLPQMRGHLGGAIIQARDMNGKWRVIYGGGTGGMVVDVDKHSGQATIVLIEQ